MSDKHLTAIRPAAYITARLSGPPEVELIEGFPGQYAIYLDGLCGAVRLHATAGQWDEIDAAVRAGIAVAGQTDVA